MRILTLKQAGEMGDKEIVPAILVSLLSFQPPRSGVKDGRPWFIQDVTLSDASGQMKASFWNWDPFTQADVGRTFHMASTKTDKGLAGISIREEVYQGKSMKKLTISTSAELPRPPTHSQEPAQMPPFSVPQAPQARSSPQTTIRTPQQALDAYKAALESRATAFKLCLDKASELLPCNPSTGWGSEDIRSVAVHLAISLERQFLADNLPPLGAGPKSQVQSPESPEDEPPF